MRERTPPRQIESEQFAQKLLERLAAQNVPGESLPVIFAGDQRAGGKDRPAGGERPRPRLLPEHRKPLARHLPSARERIRTDRRAVPAELRYAFGQPDRPDLARKRGIRPCFVAVRVFGAPAADVEYADVAPQTQPANRPDKGIARLLVSRENPQRDTRKRFERGAEFRRVVRPPECARRDSGDRGTARPSDRHELTHRAERPLRSTSGDRSALAQPLPDSRPASLVQHRLLAVDDEEPRGVRPDRDQRTHRRERLRSSTAYWRSPRAYAGSSRAPDRSRRRRCPRRAYR